MKLKRHAGFSMTEVLVSILLLSSGVVGVMGLQLASTRTTQQSSYQTMALLLAADIADTVGSMMSDERYAHAVEPLFDVDYTSSPGTSPATDGSCHFSRCGTSEFAAFEINEWKASLAANFPTARLRICRDGNPWNEAAHVYTWDCSSGIAGAPFVVKVGWKVKNPDGSYSADGAGFPPSVVIPVASI
ncbi:type IV pilus modification protein PilV [Noviherbaspirillum sp. ST9]|uniref:type IV pilus modification protein PilV n=1 Tax=Noviherbaspirillum sp. ST9 TaxID=3401606 RepID=UPI003B58AAAD